MLKLVQATPYAILMAWISFGGVELSVGHVVALIGILICMHAAAHYAGFCFAMGMVHERVQRILALVRGLVERSEGVLK